MSVSLRNGLKQSEKMDNTCGQDFTKKVLKLKEGTIEIVMFNRLSGKSVGRNAGGTGVRGYGVTGLRDYGVTGVRV